MSTSYLETVRANWTTELKAINGTGVYRNTVKEVYQDFPTAIGEYPAIVFMLGDGTIVATDSSFETYDLQIPFFVVCDISCNATVTATSTLIAAQDSLLHDVMRVVAILYNKNINAASGPRWFVLNDPPVKFSPVFPMGENTGEFCVYGTLRIRNLDDSFA